MIFRYTDIRENRYIDKCRKSGTKLQINYQICKEKTFFLLFFVKRLAKRVFFVYICRRFER